MFLAKSGDGTKSYGMESYESGYSENLVCGKDSKMDRKLRRCGLRYSMRKVEKKENAFGVFFVPQKSCFRGGTCLSSLFVCRI